MKPFSSVPLSRRLFTAGLATVSASLTRSQAVPQAPKSAPDEPAPFAESLSFTRKEITPKVRPFLLSEVQLLPGPCLDAANWNRGYMLRLPADRLLHDFRINAGLPSSATPLGGWEEPKSELRGHFTGHYLSACALRFVSAADAELKARGEAIVAGLAECQAKLGDSGYLSAFPLEFFDRLDRRVKVWAPFYTIHKIMAGLLDMHVHAGSRQALDVVTRMAAWTDSWTASKSEAHMQDILETEYGGMNEVLYNLAAVTGDDRWAKTGDRFTKKVFFNPLAQHQDRLRGLHANTHIPQVIGAARRYELSGDRRFHDVADFFWYTVTSARTYSTGGSSNREFWRAEPGHLAREFHDGHEHQECCCAYNMMKLTRHLYSWDANPGYFDYYERNLLNHRLGTIQPETGHTMYFVSLTPGAWKTLNTEDQSFWCCTGTGVEEYSKLNDSIYFQDDQGIYVNLFIASEVDARDRGIRIRQDTRFPEEPRTTLSIVSAPASRWTLRLRIPAWTTSPKVKINGRESEAVASPGSYVEISRAWKKGDRIELEMPMHLSVESMPDDSRLQSFLYGPIVLAGDLGSDGVSDELIRNTHGPNISKLPIEVPRLVASGAASGSSILEQIVPTGTEPLTFHVKGQKTDITLRPLNKSWNRYAVYWQV